MTDFSEMSYEDLKKEAKGLGIKSSGMNREDLVKALYGAQPEPKVVHIPGVRIHVRNALDFMEAIHVLESGREVTIRRWPLNGVLGQGITHKIRMAREFVAGLGLEVVGVYQDVNGHGGHDDKGVKT